MNADLVKVSKVNNLTKLPSLKEVRAERRHAKRLQKLATRQKELEVGGVIAKQLVESTGYVVGQSVRGFFNMMRGLAENDDPLTLAAGSLAGLVALNWFVLSYPNLAHTVHLDELANVLPGGPDARQQTEELLKNPTFFTIGLVTIQIDGLTVSLRRDGVIPSFVPPNVRTKALAALAEKNISDAGSVDEAKAKGWYVG